MAYLKVAPIEGCGKERRAETYIDLRTPDILGKTTKLQAPTCTENPLNTSIQLKISRLSDRSIQNKTRVADFCVSCPAANCPNHT